MAVEIWHNPRCSKSRAALAYLEAKGVTPEVRLYLKDGPSQEELRDMLLALGLPASALLRKEGAALKGEAENVIVAALAVDPGLIERPVIRNGSKAVIGRPTEAIDEIL
ncbi:ArsC/Spx/MgsR family protein [Pararhodobacter aggregans]|uniref:Arsenate reductase (Glutaredoxin) n=1 Tax=Pararhodobacter aggregans TaxID=404875 RepID=A0A2T7UJZ4_9RHOB|nr:ArsC/Spx/MgsR family protein [Pararhodobacter aggregans]PTW98932.1 arsenate reductase [Pararhodobacter aggregans]PVE44979.1 arsenate reductase (glutaredoxin) [Pararhodobacter aggregans]